MRWMTLSILIAAVSIFAMGFDPTVAGAVLLSSAAGYYVGGEMAVPTLIFMSKLGVIDEEEIFSPFSTLVYDSIESGKRFGALLGALTAKAILTGVKPSLLMDFVMECVAIEIGFAFEDYSFIAVPTLSGVFLGVIW